MSQQLLNSLSFELFPPKNLQGLEHIKTTCQQLCAYQPNYFSVTFGAAGSNQDKTLAVVDALTDLHLTVAPHLTCIGLNKEHIAYLLDHYHHKNIRHLVVIRGDLPADMPRNRGDFSYASELVEFIYKLFGSHFQIKVAAYPEFHPQAIDAMHDFENFCNKVAAGADSAITQFFFNVDAYYYFMEDCRKQNINIPIVPGIMPINNFSKLCHFAELCGAEVPLWIKKRIAAFGKDEESIQQFGIDIVTKQCQDLLEFGAPGLHFYTLNNADPARQILNNLGLRPKNKNSLLSPFVSRIVE